MKSILVRMAAIAALLLAVLLGVSAQASTCSLPSDPAAILNILFPLVDANGDGGLSLAELEALYADIPAEYYNLVDTNRDGKVTMAEITPFLSLLPSLLPSAVPGGNLLSFVDTNGNGAIEYAEVSQYVTPAQFALLDKDNNRVIDCTDIAGITPPAEGEPAEGETPPPAPCPLPYDIVPTAAKLLIPLFDMDHSGGLSLAEMQAIYPIPAEYVPLFSLIDANQNGQVEPEELVAILSSLNVDLLGEIDASGDRIIQYAEVGQYVTAAQFALLDKDGNGAIDCNDIGTITPPPPPPTPIAPCALPADILPALANLLVSIFDTDRSGGLSLAELQAIYPIPAQYAHGFFLVDLNHNGQVEPGEMAAIASAFGVDPLGEIDASGDSIVQYAEVGQYVTAAQFALLDHNGNGAFDCGDLGNIIPPAEGEPAEGEPAPVCALPADVLVVLARALIPLVDTDLSGGLSMAEVNAVYVIPAQYQSVFYILDLNHNGQLEPEDLGNVGPMLGLDPVGLIDANGDRAIGYSEVSEYLTAAQFALIDRSGNGAFDCNDLPFFVPEIVTEPVQACAIPNVNSLVFDAVFAVLDINHDGGIAMDEITRLVPAVNTSQLLPVFGLLAGGGDGLITRSALDMLPSLSSALCVVMPDTGILGIVDANHDGLLQPSEVSPYVNASLFARLDANGNGVLDCEDVNALLPGNPTEGEPVEGEPVEGEHTNACPLPDVRPLIPRLALLLDANHDGRVCEDEARSFVTPLVSMIPSAVAVNIFAIADQDGDGCLNAGELGALANQLPDPVPFIDRNGNGVLELAEFAGLIDAAQFAMADANHNGVIDCEDLAAILALLGGNEGEAPVEGEPVEGEPGVFCPLPAESIFAVAIRLADLNGDGGVSLLELQAAVPQVPVQVFPLADTNSDGVIDETELKAFASTPIIQTLLPQPQPTPAEMLALVDTNHNGVIEFAEISSVFTRDRFAVLDLNQNGVIDCEDLTVTPPSEGEVGPAEGEPPAEGEGEVSGLDDLLQHLHGSHNLAGLMTDAFGLLDTNGDSALSFAEISARIKLPRAVFNAADTNGNGMVTLEELSALARQAAEQPGKVIDLVREVVGRFGNQFFAPGDVIRVTLRLIKHGDGVLSQLHLLEALPEGWVIRLVSGAEGVSAKSVAGNALVLDWGSATAFPLQIVYEATAPANAAGLLTVTGQADYETADGAAESTGAVASVLAEALPQEQAHTADVDGDWRLSLSEVLRVVQLYNAGGYGAEGDTEDGFAPGSGKQQAGIPHDADCNGDWAIDISELLRVVQLFNAPGGAYYRASGTEDGFVPGIF